MMLNPLAINSSCCHERSLQCTVCLYSGHKRKHCPDVRQESGQEESAVKTQNNTKLSHVIEDKIKNNDILLTQTSDCNSPSDLYENEQGVYVSNDSNNDLSSHVIHNDTNIHVDFNVSNYLDNDIDVNAILNVSNDLNNDISSPIIKNDTSVNNAQIVSNDSINVCTQTVLLSNITEIDPLPITLKNARVKNPKSLIFTHINVNSLKKEENAPLDYF